MSPKVFLIAVVPLANNEDRDEMLDQLAACAEHAWANEPGTLKYATFILRDPEKENTLYVVEEYSSRETLDKHLLVPRVQSLISWMTATDASPLSGTPTMHRLSLPSETFMFSRPRVAEFQDEDPWVIIAELDYFPGGSETSIKYWEGVVDEGRKNEEGTLVYAVARDRQVSEKMWTIEVYENEAYLKDVHVKSKAIDESIRNTKHLRTGLSWTFLKWHSGFLHKESS